MLNIKQIKELNIWPNKRMGQNFLVDRNVLHRIGRIADLKEGDNVLEIGPGLGSLTERLDGFGANVVSIEKDKVLAAYLSGQELPNTQIVEADALKLTDEELKGYFDGKPYKVVANLPYNITGAFLKKYLQREYQPTEMILMIQREVGERLVEKPGRLSVLSVATQYFSRPKIMFDVHPASFFPRPRVESVVVKLADISHTKHDVDDEKFFEIVKKGFSSKRKQLKNNLDIDAEVLTALGFLPTVRAQELSIGEWVRLVRKLGDSE